MVINNSTNSKDSASPIKTNSPDKNNIPVKKISKNTIDESKKEEKKIIWPREKVPPLCLFFFFSSSSPLFFSLSSFFFSLPFTVAAMATATAAAAILLLCVVFVVLAQGSTPGERTYERAGRRLVERAEELQRSVEVRCSQPLSLSHPHTHTHNVARLPRRTGTTTSENTPR